MSTISGEPQNVIDHGSIGSSKTLDQKISVSGVICASLKNCWVAGNEFDASAPGNSYAILIPFKNGVVGTVHVLKTLAYLAGGLACPSSTVCWASAYTSTSQPGIVKFNPTTGVVQQFPVLSSADHIFSAGEGGDRAFVCVSISTCIALGLSHYGSGGTGVEAVIVNGSLSSVTPVPGTSLLSGLSCASATMCQGVGLSDAVTPTGVWVSFSNHVPSKPTVVAADWLASVFCLSTTWCVAGGFSFHSGVPSAVLAKHHASAYGATVLKATATVESLVCFSSSSCLAVGSSGSTNLSSNGLVVSLPPPA